MSGIVGKIWPITAGGGKRPGYVQLLDSLNYILDHEKCDEHLKDDSKVIVGKELNYITNDVKTLEGLYVGGRFITDVSDAMNEMMQVKTYFNKLSGRIAYHGIISLPEEESDVNNAGKLMLLCDELMEKLYPQYQVVYAVHTNTDNLHIHFFINSVGLDGKKIHMPNDYMDKVFHPALNRLARKYGFTPNPEWEKTKKDDSLTVVERKMVLRKLMDLSIENADSFDEFIELLRKTGSRVNVGKNISIQMPGMPKAMRTYQLGSFYTIEKIQERIATKRDPFKEVEREQVVSQIRKRNVISYTAPVLKKYKDMSAAERSEVIALLKNGRNPWIESRKDNWQLKYISEDLDRDAFVYDIIVTYSRDGNTKAAKDRIVELQKKLSKNKAEVKAISRDYRPQMDLYKQAKECEKRAYLFEFGGCEEYKDDYLEYKELCRRLKENYSKSIDEVAALDESIKDELLYINAQIEELSQQYKAIMRYEKRAGLIKATEDVAFYEAVGHGSAINAFREHGSLTTRMVTLASEKADDVLIRVVTTPDIINGKSTVTTTVTIQNLYGDIIDTFSSANLSTQAFNHRLNSAKADYGFHHCNIYESVDEARAFVSSIKAEEVKVRQ